MRRKADIIFYFRKYYCFPSITFALGLPTIEFLFTSFTSTHIEPQAVFLLFFSFILFFCKAFLHSLLKYSHDVYIFSFYETFFSFFFKLPKMRLSDLTCDVMLFSFRCFTVPTSFRSIFIQYLRRRFLY